MIQIIVASHRYLAALFLVPLWRVASWNLLVASFDGSLARHADLRLSCGPSASKSLLPITDDCQWNDGCSDVDLRSMDATDRESRRPSVETVAH